MKYVLLLGSQMASYRSIVCDCSVSPLWNKKYYILSFCLLILADDCPWQSYVSSHLRPYFNSYFPATYAVELVWVNHQVSITGHKDTATVWSIFLDDLE